MNEGETRTAHIDPALGTAGWGVVEGKRRDNVGTYSYFGEPVFIYSLKEDINDGFLTRVSRAADFRNPGRLRLRAG